MRTFIASIAALVASTAAAIDQLPLQLELLSRVVLPGTTVRLGDVVASPESIDEKTRATIVASYLQASPGVGLFLERNAILDALAVSNPGQCIEWSGASGVRVYGSARLIDTKDVAEAIREQLRQTIGLQGRPESVEIGHEAHVVACDVDAIEVELPVGVTSQRRSSARLRFAAGGRFVSETHVAFSWRWVVPAWRITRIVPKGDSIGCAFETVEVDRLAYPSAVEIFAAQAERDWVATRELRPGQVIRTRDIAQRELVRRGQTICVTAELSSGSLKLQCRALTGGILGDSIEVLNPATGRRIHASVTGPSEAIVNR
jgi:flagella basal body P-ring formation protein FlgA